MTGCTHALVTAPSSATSLAIMQLLKSSAIPFTILARNESYVSKLHSLGFDRIIIADPSSSDFQTILTSKLSALSITHVFDNFPDVYAFHLTLSLLTPVNICSLDFLIKAFIFRIMPILHFYFHRYFTVL